MSALEQKTYPLLERRAEGDLGVISGYASTYAKDEYGDRIAPGAFASSVAAKKGKYPILTGHDMHAIPIGFTTYVAEDHKGLNIAAQLALATDNGRNAFALVKAAEAADFPMGLSIGFISKEWDDTDDGGRLIKEIDLWEISITAFPANRFARIEDAKQFRIPDRRSLLVGIESHLRLTASRINFSTGGK